MSVCGLCGSDANVSEFQIKPTDKSVLLCEVCKTQIESKNLDENHFNCLNDSMWSEDSSIKILTYRLLKELNRGDLLDMMYLEEDELNIANYEEEILKDSNGNILQDGDSVSVIKDLEVKGAGKTVKRGTTVKNIRMCDVAGHVSCKVDGIGSIYLKAEFLKKL